MKAYQTAPSRWQKFVSGLALFAVASLTALSFSGCGGSSSSADPPPTVAAPAAPTNFTATAGENLVDLSWSPPAESATAGLPTSYVIYVSKTIDATAELVFVPENLLATIPVVDGKTAYTFTNSGLEGTTTYYYVVTAKNAGGETPSTLASAKPSGPPKPPTAGNNFSAALIFADDIGIGNLPITGVWTLDKTLIDYNTGLRPLATEVITTLPFLTVPSTVDPLYFEQKSVNTWQGEWAKGKATPQEVNAKWGDNLAGDASLSSTAKIRIEMVLSKTVDTPMTTYAMKSLYGAKLNEMFGTNGVVIPTTTAFVMASNAHLKIEKLDATTGLPTGEIADDQALFDSTIPDGLNKLSAEIPVSGNFTYGYVWDPQETGSTAGKYRVTFLLDATSEHGVGNPANNTFMKTATNGERVSDTEVYIDITVK